MAESGGRAVKGGVEAAAPAQKARMFTCKPRLCRALCVLPLPSVARGRASAPGNVRPGALSAGPKAAVII